MAKAALLLGFLTLAAGCVLESQPLGPGNRSLDGGAGTGGVAGTDGGVGTGGSAGLGGSAGTGGAAGSAGTGGTAGTAGSGGTGEIGDCTPATEDDDCDGKSCNPATLRCSEIYADSRGPCETCFSDSDCWGWNHRCAEMRFQGERFPDEQTGFCLPVAEADFIGAPYRCDDESPYVTVLYDRPSLSGGAVETYCGVREDFTTCYAVLVQQQEGACPAGRDDECPAGGLCRYLEYKTGQWEYRCTYACTAAAECVDKAGKPLECGGYCGS
jgi:hypothetical protein